MTFLKFALVLLIIAGLATLVVKFRKRKRMLWVLIPLLIYSILALGAGLLWLLVVEDAPPDGPTISPDEIRGREPKEGE
ncbi:MAG: hypothetical protein WBH75_10110 [Thermoanaerobaculia bacterium]